MVSDVVQPLADAEFEAQRFVEQLRKGAAVDEVLASADDPLKKLESAGYSPTEFLDDDDSHNFNFPAADFAGRFYRAYTKIVRRSLCGGDPELKVMVSAALNSGVASGLTALAVALSVPGGAVVVLAPIVAILIVKGIDAFCEVTSEEI